MTDWEPLCEKNPIPGNPTEVSRAGKRYQQIGSDIAAQATNLRKIADGDMSSLTGDYVKVIKDAAGGLHSDLSKAKDRYTKVGGELVSWSGKLEGYQAEAEALRKRAVSAGGDMSSNKPIQRVSAPGTPLTDEEKTTDSNRKKAYDAASGVLGGIQAELGHLTDKRDKEGRRVAKHIKDDSDDGVKDGFWDNVWDWFDKHSDLVNGIIKVLGVIAVVCAVICLVVPGLNIAAGALLVSIATGTGIVAGVGSLVGHVGLYMNGKASGWDIALDVVGLATFGLGRVATPFIRAGASEAGAAKAGVEGAQAAINSTKATTRTVKALTNTIKSSTGATRAEAIAARQLARSTRLARAGAAEAAATEKALAAVPKVSVVKSLLAGPDEYAKYLATMRAAAKSNPEIAASLAKAGLGIKVFNGTDKFVNGLTIGGFGMGTAAPKWYTDWADKFKPQPASAWGK